MKLKQLLLVTTLFVSGVYSDLNAQVLTSQEQDKIERRIETFMYELNLSEKDKVQFASILRDQFVALVAVSASNYSEKTKYKVLKITTKDRDRNMKLLLNKEQYKQYKAKLKKSKKNLIDASKQQ
ncbi:MAG: hypothetical protein ACI8UQ_000213 [Bacteroidia bacterium]|jgi:hypothetical protein